MTVKRVNVFGQDLFWRESLPYMGDGLTSIIRLRSELKASGEAMNTPMANRLTGAGAAQGGYRGSKTAARRGPRAVPISGLRLTGSRRAAYCRRADVYGLRGKSLWNATFSYAARFRRVLKKYMYVREVT